MSFIAKVLVKPWEHAGELEALADDISIARAKGRSGLTMFLAVISVMFILFMVSYYTRSRFPDWEVMRDPDILWFNTAVLAMASVALQLASNAARQQASQRLRITLIVGALLTLVFIVGQWMAWEEMLAAGYYAASNPANAFFYLFTGLHALHLVGGLWFMGMLGFRFRRKESEQLLAQSVALCATYWHYLLLVWLALFTLLLRT